MSVINKSFTDVIRLEGYIVYRLYPYCKERIEN